MQAPYRIQQGKILIYHLFDIADIIDLEKLRTKWAGRSTSIRLVSRRSSPYYMQFEKRAPALAHGQNGPFIDTGCTSGFRSTCQSL